MPNQDRTGPLGQGPMTGGGFGLCGGGQGRGQGGYGMGQGGGFFRFGRFPRGAALDQTPDPAQERISALEREIADLKEQLRNR